MSRAVTWGLTTLSIGAVAVAVALPLEGTISTSPPPSAVISVGTPEPVVACPGPLKTPLDDDGGGDLSSSPTATQHHSYFGGSSEKIGEGDFAAVAVAAQSDWAADGDIASIAAITCTQPSNEQWLVGGSSALGNSARLVLSNPQDSPTEVTVTLWGLLGQDEETVTIAVGPGRQQEVLLESVVADNPNLVVRVQATGVGVVAALQSSDLDGFQPAGTDWISPIAAPAQALVIPYVQNFDQNQSVKVRIFSLSNATVSVDLATSEGVVPLAGAQDLSLVADQVTELLIPQDAVAGNPAHALVLRSTAPIVAAAVSTQSRPAAEGVEGSLAHETVWVNAQTVDVTGSWSTYAPGYEQALVMYSPRAVTATFHIGGETREIVMGAGQFANVPIDAAAGTLVSTDAPVVWALVSRTSPGFVTAVQPVGVSPAELSVEVSERDYRSSRP